MDGWMDVVQKIIKGKERETMMDTFFVIAKLKWWEHGHSILDDGGLHVQSIRKSNAIWLLNAAACVRIFLARDTYKMSE